MHRFFLALGSRDGTSTFLRYDGPKRDKSQGRHCRKNNNDDAHRDLRHRFLLSFERTEP
jgi:hypothetical protein